ncbi:MAG: cytochrome c oxidase subunit 3 [Flavobacteriales bacterium]
MKARRNLTYLVLFSIVMFFSALLSAYVVSKGSTDYWVTFKLPGAFWASTAVILVSSLTIQLALVAARKGRTSSIAPLLGLTLLLGLGFTACQFKGWGQLFDRGLALVSRLKSASGTYGEDYAITRRGVPLDQVNGNFYLPTDVERANPLNAEMDEYKNTASSYFYVLTYAHWAHLLIGLVALLVMTVMAMKGRYTAADHTGLWAGTLYWHFLAGLWVLILSFLAVVH